MLMSSLFYPVTVPDVGDEMNRDYVNSDFIMKFKTVKSLSRLCMENVLSFPSLVEQISPDLPQLVRKDLISLSFKSIKEPTFKLSSLRKLFETWSEDRINIWQLAFKHRNMF